MIDLHTHTVFSDGTTTPTQNAALAAAEGLTGVAITDHDTLGGWAEAADACAGQGLAFVPGIELSTEAAGRSVHLLGYWCDPEDEQLAAECERLRGQRSQRAERMLERLAALGVACSLDRVLAHAGGAPIGRPHIAAAMVDAGGVPDVRAAFDDYIGDGGPAYVVKHALSPADGVRLIRAAGGAAVIAHPGLADRDAPTTTGLVAELVAVGLAGVEADHAGHEAGTAAFWRAFARERDLLVTGSSDFHGDRDHGRIGERGTPVATVEALRLRCGAPGPKEWSW
ncbi:MAG: PHP domain-containing protein [Egibacteraceae bacterium]